MIPLLLGLAFGHGVDHDQVLIDVDGPKARVTLTPRATTFPWADDDGDGALSVDEIRAHRARIDAAVATGFQIVDQQGRSGTITFADVVRPHDFGHGHGGQHLRVIQHHTFPDEVTAIEATVSLFAPEVDEALVAVQIQHDPVRTFRVDAPAGRVIVEPVEPLPVQPSPPTSDTAAQLVWMGAITTLGLAAGLGLVLGRRRAWDLSAV